MRAQSSGEEVAATQRFVHFSVYAAQLVPMVILLLAR